MLSKSTETLFWVSTFFLNFSCKILACFDDCLSVDLFWSWVCCVLVVLVSGNLGNCWCHSQRQWCHTIYINCAHVDSAAFSHWILSEACLTIGKVYLSGDHAALTYCNIPILSTTLPSQYSWADPVCHAFQSGICQAYQWYSVPQQ